MADRYSDDRYRGEPYRGEPYRGERGYGRDERPYGRDDRGLIDRAGDEVRSWFGDEDAERRRRMDEREQERNYGRDRSEYDRNRNWRDSAVGERGLGSERWGQDYSRPDYERSRPDYERPGWGSSSSSRPGAEWRSGGDDWRYGRSSGRATAWRAAGEAFGTSAGYGEDRWRDDRGFAGRGPKGYQRSDSRITEDVCDRLADAPDIDASSMEVKVSAGEVTLAGTVANRWEKRRAEDLIENISGVREVHNHLKVSGSQPSTPTTTPPTVTASR